MFTPRLSSARGRLWATLALLGPSLAACDQPPDPSVAESRMSSVSAPVDQYLVGDWDGDGKKNLAVRVGACVFMDTNFDGVHDRQQCYGNGNSQQYLVGDWDGDGRDNLAVRSGNCVMMDFNFDGVHDRMQCYGNGDSQQYLVGDWDGDGRDNLAVRSGACVAMDFNFDGTHERQQCYGNGDSQQYLVGDWDGDGRDNLAVRSGNCVVMDTNFDGKDDLTQCYGGGAAEDEYLTGDWNGDRRTNLAVRRNACVFMDTNFDGTHDQQQCFGNGTRPPPPPPSVQPAAPSNVRVTGFTRNTVSLAWQNNAPDQVNVRILWRPDDLTGGRFDVVDARSTSYTATDLAPGTTYCFRVQALASVDSSDPSAEVCATPGTPAPSTGNLRASLTMEVFKRQCGPLITVAFQAGGRTQSNGGVQGRTVSTVGEPVVECTWTTVFALAPGNYVVTTPAQGACASATVVAGLETSVGLQRNAICR
jgi:hypothetical protein